MRAETVVIFMGVFWVVMLATFPFPGLPPGEEIVKFLNISLADISGTGISTTVLLAAVFNGLIYGAVASLIYALARSLPEMVNRDIEH
jgi:hypothetical protein